MDKECFRLNSQKEKLEETKEAQTSYLWEEYEVTPKPRKRVPDGGDSGAQ